MAIKLTYSLSVAGLLLPLSAFALSLGDINSQSRLDQQLDARIPITASAQEIDSLKVRLAPDEAFERVNLDKPTVLNHLHFELIRAEGQTYIHVTSDEAIHEPFLRFLVQAYWSQGQVVREYTVLLDPPVLMEGAAKQTSNSAQVINPPASTASPIPTKRPLAAVGVQPFGGHGLSGTGPKAGGPNYLLRFTTEQTLTVNTAAVGGDPALIGLDTLP